MSLVIGISPGKVITILQLASIGRPKLKLKMPSERAPTVLLPYDGRVISTDMKSAGYVTWRVIVITFKEESIFPSKLSVV
jgi:hypothetical protein